MRNTIPIVRVLFALMLIIAISCGSLTAQAQSFSYWYYTYRSPNGGNATVQTVADREDNCVVVTAGYGLLGPVTNPAGNIQVVLLKYTPDGYYYFNPIPIELAGHDYSVPAVTVDRASSIYVAFIDIENFGLSSNITVQKYSKDGVLQWSHRYRPEKYSITNSPHIAVDLLGNVSVGGWLQGTELGGAPGAGNHTITAAFVASWDTNGNYINDCQYEAFGDLSDGKLPWLATVQDIRIAPDNSIIVVGNQFPAENPEGGRGFILSFGPSGTAGSLPGSRPPYDGGDNSKVMRGSRLSDLGSYLYSVCSDPYDGSAYVAGYIVRKGILGGSGDKDILVEHYNTASGLARDWSRTYDGGSSKQDVGTKVVYSEKEQTIRVVGGTPRPTSPPPADATLPAQPVMLTLDAVTGSIKSTSLPFNPTGWDSYLDVSLDKYGYSHFGGGASADRFPYASYPSWSYYSDTGGSIYWTNTYSSFARAMSVAAVPTGDAYTGSVLGGGVNGIGVFRIVYVPVAIDDQYSMFADQGSVSDNVLLNDTRIKWPEHVSAEITAQPLNGTVSLDSIGYFTYRPNPGFSGKDSFRYRIKKSVGPSTYVYSEVPDSTAFVNRGTAVITVNLRPLHLSGVSVSSITATEAVVTWTTDFPSTSNVWFGKTKPSDPTSIGSYSNGVNDSALVTKHSVKLTGLTPGTLYYFLALSKSPTSTTATATGNFVTANLPAPSVTVSSVSLSRQGSDIVATVILANTGATTARNVVMSTVSLGGATPVDSPLPVSVGDLAAGASRTGSFRFPGSLGAAGVRSVLQISGSYTGGAFSSGIRAVLP